MTPWIRAIVTLVGVAAAPITFTLFGVLPAGMVTLATLWFAASGPSIIGTTNLADDAGGLDPREVRRYREDHPGTTISEAAAAVARRRCAASTRWAIPRGCDEDCSQEHPARRTRR